MEEKLKNVMSKILNVNLKNLSQEEINPNNIKEWDSLAHLKIMISLEQEFGIEIEPNEIYEMQKGFRDMINIVEKKMSL